MIKIDCAIIDLDNCISDDSWRMNKILKGHPDVWERYREYHEWCHLDPYANEQVIRNLAMKFPLIAFTARPELFREKTERWRMIHSIPLHGLFMRPNDNHECSVILKRKMLHEIREKGFTPRHAIDDRVDILDMYAEEGVQVCQRVFIHNQEAH